jgi:hypothetical protein
MPTYWLDLFSPRTWEEARQNGFNLTGFRQGRWSVVSKIKPSDLFICYLTQLGRFSGILRAISKPYQDEAKARTVWIDEPPFSCLVDVEPVLTFDFLHSLPKNEILSKLSVDRKWGGLIRGSPRRIPTVDGQLILQALKDSNLNRKEYPLVERPLRPRIGKPRLKRQEYGTPIDFRGLRHAPLNEQGVVYLFALVARELGFIVEAIGTSYPDCEAKKRVDRKGERWQRVRIEFEYYSSNFKDHGHSPDRCDLIVCWKHNWTGCPVPVIELSTEIRKLGARFEEPASLIIDG